MMKNHHIHYGIGAALLSLLTGLWAAPALAFQPLDDIYAAVRQFIDASLPAHADLRREVEINTLDPRLRLAACSEPLQTFTPGSQRGRGTITVGVHCAGESPWKIYVPVQIKTFRKVVVTTRPVPKGSPLSQADVELQERDVTRLTSGFFTEVQTIAGMVAKRPLNTGEILSAASLQAPTLVHKGDKVRIVVRPGAFEVMMMGEALRDGGVGDRIPVRNLSSGRIIEANVNHAGEVEIIF